MRGTREQRRHAQRCAGSCDRVPQNVNSKYSLRRVAVKLLLAESLAASAIPCALAEQHPPSVRLEYTAADSCPPVGEFVAEVRKRLRGFAPDSHAADSNGVQVRLTEEDSLVFVGEARFESRAEPPAYRRVEGASCEEVAQALAIVVSIVLEPPRASEPPRALPAVLSQPPPRPTITYERARSALALEGGVTSTMAPWPAWYVQVLTELRLRAVGLRFGPELAWRDDVASPEGVTSFRRLDALIEAGTVRLPLFRGVELEPVVGLAVGGLHAKGSTALGGRSSWTPWVAPNLAGRLLYSPKDAFRLGLTFAVEFPLVRNRFYLLSEESSVFQVPVVGVRAGANLAYRFL
jgi:hypothetical protein